MVTTAAQILTYIDAFLHRRSCFDRVTPTRNIREFVQRLTERFRNEHPGPGNHVGDRIVIKEILSGFETSFQYTKTTIVFACVPLVRVAMICLTIDALGIVHEMTELA